MSLILIVLYIVGLLLLAIFYPDQRASRILIVMLFIIVGIKLFAGGL